MNKLELLDVYDSLGNKTGRVVERGNKDEIFGEDEHIAVAIIYIENDKGEFLIQKTSKEKGGHYSSTGGHINHGEDAYSTIVREVKEELGVDISNDNIISLGHICVDFPVRFMFYLKKNINLNDIVLQKDEVESVSYISVDKIKDLLDEGLMNKGHYKVLEKVLDYKKEKSMLQNIEIYVDNKEYQIEWNLSEHFAELKGMKFMLNEMAADQIVKINNISETAKILLSAVAGAVIQYLLDNNCPVNSIFEKGYFIIKN